MSPEQGAAAIAVVAIIAYALFGGADFGGGVWTLFATGPRAGDQRNALERAIGPVWETNHVWLILVVVLLFVVFPVAYATIFTAMYVPLFLALLGIVSRGAAFAFRHYGSREWELSSVAMRLFSVASVATPFFLGVTVGGVTVGSVKLDGETVTTGAWTGWTEPFSLLCGLIGVLVCAYVGAAFMVPRTEGLLQRDFRRRAMIAALALGVATTVAIPVAAIEANEFSGHLNDPDVLAAMAFAALAGIATLWALRDGWTRTIPVLAGATVTGVIGTWALAQNPYLVAGQLTIQDAAAAGITVKSFLIALPLGSLILVPSLVLLYTTFSRDTFAAQGDSQG
jgi:cytochrome d ubiquinol oxidase subunit II